MPENQPNPSDLPQGPGSEPPKAPTPPKRKRRKWPWVLGSLSALLLLVVLLAPTIASTSLGRNAVVGIVNDNVNGSVQIDDWSFGWFANTSVSGIKVFDADKRLILDVPSAKINLTLLNAIRQRFAIGSDSQIDVASFIVNVDENGKTNFEKLVKNKPREPSDKATELPDVSGRITVNILGGTIEGDGVREIVHVRPSSAVVNITDINQPITNDVKLAYQVGNREEVSTIEVSGTVNAIKNNMIDIDELKAGQTVALNRVNLAVLEPFLKKHGENLHLAGEAQGKLDVKAESPFGITANGTITLSRVEFSGGPLGADTFRSSTIDIPVNITRDGKVVRFDNVGVKMDQASFSVTGQVDEQALMNLSKNQAPGGNGSITVSVDIPNVAKLTEQLPNTLKLQKGVTVTAGSVKQQLVFTVNPQSLSVSQNLNVTGVNGTRDNRPIQLSPITVAAEATAFPRGTPIPEMRDVKLNVDSTFAKVSGGGASLAKLLITGNLDLSKLAAEVGQFADLGKTQLAGTGDFKISTNGDLASDNAPINGEITANLQNVKVTGLADQQIDQDRLALVASGVLMRENKAPVSIDKGYVAITSGDPRAPMLEVYADAQVNLKNNSVPWFKLTKCNVMNLAKLQQQYGAFVPALAANKLVIGGGAVHAQLAGSFVDNTLTISEPLFVSVPGLSISKEGRPLLSNETITASVDGSVSLKDGISGALKTLSVTSQSKLFDLSKAGEVPLNFTMTKQAIRGGGTMSLAGDLPRLAAIAQAFGGKVEVTPETPQLTAGKLNGTLVLTKEELNRVKFSGQITGLAIALDGKNQLENETVAIALNASAPDDLSKQAVQVDGTIKSKIVNTNLTDVRLMPQAGLYEMVRSASITAQVPDLPMAMALVSAFSPVLGDLQITSGGATVKMTVAHIEQSKTTTIDIPDCRVSKLRIKKLSRSYNFDPNNPIALKLKANVSGTNKLESVTIEELSGDLRVATLSMPRKLVMKMGEKPSYDGAIKLEGKLDDVTPLLAVIQNAEPMPYAGAYALNQEITTTGDKATLKGTVDVNNFQVLEARKAVFTEPNVAIRNDLDVDLKQQKLAVKTLTIEMPQSKAVAMSFTGGVNFWRTERQIREGTKLDLTYDLAQLWKILYPMLSPEQQASHKDLKIAGRYTKTFNLSGAFPDNPKGWRESLKSLKADGAFAVDSLETMGLSVQKLEPTVRMNNGIVKLYGTAAAVNGGKLDVEGVMVDMSHPDMLLTVPPKKVLLKDVALNTVLASQLGKMGAVLFTDATAAEGKLTVTVVECKNVPIGALTAKNTRARATVQLEVDQLFLDGIVPRVLSGVAELETNGLRGKVPPSTIKVQTGQADSNLTVLIARRVRDERGRESVQDMPLTLTGRVGLEKLDLHDFFVGVPGPLLPSKLRQLAPNGVKVAMKGYANKPELDLAGSFGKSLEENLGGALENLIRGK